MNISPPYCFIFFLVWSWTFCLVAVASAGRGPGTDIEEAEFLLLELKVERLLTSDFEGYLYDEQLYLPATQLLTILKLPYTYHEEQLLLEVSFPASGRKVRVNFAEYQIRGSDQAVAVSENDFMIGTDDIYLRREWVEQVFNFNILFDYRRLAVMLFAGEELPVIQEYRRKQLYKSFERDTRVMSPDVAQPASHHLFKGWIADWSLSTSHNPYHQDYAYGLGLGGHILGGDLSLHTRGSRTYGIRWNQIHGQWKLPFYNSSYIRQLAAGDLSQKNVLSGNYLSYRGIRITNRPNAPRRIFGTHRFSGYLPDGWDAELYVNNKLSGIAVSDRQDSLDFSLPLRYGSNTFALRYYDPQATRHQREFLIHIPHEFLPRGKIEYDFSAGHYRSLNAQPFAHAGLKWGATSHMTLGGGVHYAPEVSPRKKIIPFLETWIRIGNQLILEGSHAYEYLTEGSLRYTLPSTQLLHLNFKKYHQTSIHNRLGKSLEASLNTSIPIKLPFLRVSTFLSTDYTEHQSSRFLSFYGGASSSFPLGMSLRFNSQIRYRSTNKRPLEQMQHISSIDVSKRILRRYLLRPSIRYNHDLNEIIHSQLEVSRRVFKNGFLSFLIQHNHQLKQNNFFLRLTLNLPFARHSSYVSTTQSYPIFRQTTSGTIAIDQRSRLHTDDRSWIGKAAVRIDPFLDFNNNARQDKGEPPVKGLRADFYEGLRTDTPVYRNRQIASHLTPYESYTVQVDGSSMDNPLWVPKDKTYYVQVNPNMITRIAVPVLAIGEVAGKVKIQGKTPQYNLNNLTVHLSNNDNSFRDTLRTYTNGSFFYVGLRPGHYTATLDQQQLTSLALRAVRDSVEFVIEPRREGDIVEGITLKVAPEQSETPGRMLLDKVYAIQIGAFKKRSNAAHLANTTQKLTNLTASIVYDAGDKLYKCRLGLFSHPETAWNYLESLQNEHPDLYRNSFVIEMEVEQTVD